MVNRPKIHRLVRTNHIAGLSPAANLWSHKRDSILDSARLFFPVLIGPRFHLHPIKNPGISRSRVLVDYY